MRRSFQIVRHMLGYVLRKCRNKSDVGIYLILKSSYKIRLPPSGLVVKSRLQQQLDLTIGKYLFNCYPPINVLNIFDLLDVFDLLDSLCIQEAYLL